MKSFNQVTMKGRLHNYALEALDTEKGEAIAGEITLEVDEGGTLVSMRFYGNPTYSSGKPNKTYAIMDDMMNGQYKTVVDDGDEADWFELQGSIDVSYFVGRDSPDGVVKSQKMRGSFINPNRDKKYLNKWKLDLLITNTAEVEADEEKKAPRFAKVNGFLIDDYRERLMEVQFEARSEGAINYILGLEASFDRPYFVSTWGEMQKVSRLVVRKNAFGDDETDEYTSTKWVITGMNPEAYEFGEETAITEEAYKNYKDNLETHKKEKEEEAKSNAAGGSTPAALPF